MAQITQTCQEINITQGADDKIKLKNDNSGWGETTRGKHRRDALAWTHQTCLLVDKDTLIHA